MVEIDKEEEMLKYREFFKTITGNDDYVDLIELSFNNVTNATVLYKKIIRNLEKTSQKEIIKLQNLISEDDFKELKNMSENFMEDMYNGLLFAIFFEGMDVDKMLAKLESLKKTIISYDKFKSKNGEPFENAN